MKIAFIFKTNTISDPLGIMYISAALKKAGHKTIIVCPKTENLTEKLKDFQPDILAYSITTGAHQYYLSLNKELKKQFKVYSVFGGPHTTFYPEIINEGGVDAICRGEGEEAFVEFVNKLEKKESVDKVKNFWIKKGNKIIKNPVRDLVENLDKLPFLDREIVYKKYEFFLNLKIKRFMASRGCPFDCTYCFNRHYNALYKNKGRIVRYRSVKNVIDEIKEVRSKYPLKVVKFVDDTFNLDKIWLKEFCEKYKKEVGLPFVCNIRADITTEEDARKLKEANCIMVYMGIESASERIRKEVLGRNVTNEQILNVCKLLKKYKIKIVTQNMLGIPSEKLKDSFDTILFNSKCKPDFPGFSIFQPYPNTVIADYAIKNGFFDGNFENLSNTFFNYTVLNYNPKEKRYLENLYKFSIITARYPYIAFLVKILIKFPRNKIYDIIYKISYGLSLWKIYSIIMDSPLESIKLMRKFFGYLS